MTTSQPRQPKGQPVGGQFAGKHQTGDEVDSLTPAVTNLSERKPTRLSKSELRKYLPFRKDDKEIIMFKHDDELWWTDRYVMATVKNTIDPYFDPTVIGENNADSFTLRGNKNALAVTDSPLEYKSGGPYSDLLAGFTKQHLPENIHELFDENKYIRIDNKNGAINYHMHEYREDQHVYAINTNQERHTLVDPERLHIVLGTTDTTDLDNITIHQVKNKNHKPLILMRDENFIGAVMPMLWTGN